MKSVISLLLCLVMIFTLSACAAGKERFVLEESYSTVSFDLSGMNIKGTLNYKSKDDIAFIVTEPKNLSDISFSTDEITAGDVKIEFSGPKEESPVYMLLSVIDDLSKKEIFLPSKGNFTFNGDMSISQYKVVFDCENRKIKSIEAGKFTYRFE